MTGLRFTTAAAALAALAVLAGCVGNQSRVSRLPPSPSGSVTTQQLPPPTYPQGGQASEMDSGDQMAGDQMDSPNATPGEDGTFGQPQQQVAVANTGSAPTKEDVLGQWSISASGETCQIVVSLTGWQGGHRASTRGCSSPELKNIGAWNVEGNYVVLKDNDGNALGRLAQAGTGYQGRLELGGGVSMTR